MISEYSECRLCPRDCRVNRYETEGICKMGHEMRVARASLHFWEEPCISGKSGSGTVFFAGCPMHCIFCQNYAIANLKSSEAGREVSVERLAEIFFELKEKGANNINLVTADHFVPSVVKAIDLAKSQGFDLPFVYNTSSFVKKETLRLLEGRIDIYLPDLKYISDNLSFEMSKSREYPSVAKEAIDEMYRQVGKPCFYEKNNKNRLYTAKEYNEIDEEYLSENEILIKKGVVVRHLILPNNSFDSKKVVEYLLRRFKNDIYISIMNQYTPVISTERAKELGHQELLNKVCDEEYENILDYAIDMGIENGFIQEGETSLESFIPEFDGRGVV